MRNSEGQCGSPVGLLDHLVNLGVGHQVVGPSVEEVLKRVVFHGNVA